MNTKKYYCGVLFLLLMFFTACKEQKLSTSPSSETNLSQAVSIFDSNFDIKLLDGSSFNLKQLAGKKILIVNTASKCGYTKQYEGLEKLYQLHKDKLMIIGFPSNNFLFQEPGSNEDIASFCKLNYGVSFIMSQKISVKGKEQAPIYQWLTQKAKNGVMDADVTWNFNKFLLDENGKLITKYGSSVEPMSETILQNFK